MNLGKKKQLAAEVLGVGKNKIKFANDKLPEIKEAITKQDIRELYSGGFITIKPIRGIRKKIKRKTKIGPGKIRIKVKTRKRDYIRITRKLRGYLKELKNQRRIDNETYWQLRTKVKARYFKSKAYLKEYLKGIEKTKAIESSEAEIKAGKPRKQENKKEKTKKAKTKEGNKK